MLDSRRLFGAFRYYVNIALFLIMLMLNSLFLVVVSRENDCKVATSVTCLEKDDQEKRSEHQLNQEEHDVVFT